MSRPKCGTLTAGWSGFPVHFERLSREDSKIVAEGLRAAADGPFFPEWEFRTIFGLERAEVRRVADEWPLPTLPPEIVVRAVNNSFNWLLNYPHKKWEMWGDWISVSPPAFNELFNRLRGKRNETAFERFM